MKRHTHLTIVTGLLLATINSTIEAEPPPYLLLRTHSAPVARPASSAHYSGVGDGKAAQSYSYGWFGAQPRQHWSRHFGYYRNFTQWSGK